MRLAVFLPALATATTALVVSQEFHIQQQEQPEWNSRADEIRDTVETFYGTVVDDVMSVHTEKLLVRLTRTPIPQRMPLLQSQAQSLSLVNEDTDAGHVWSDACIAKLPSYIGHQIRQQHNRVIEILPSTVDEALSAVWPEYRLAGAVPMAQYQVASMLYSVNLAVNHRLRQSLETFGLLDRLYEDLRLCESTSQGTTTTTTTAAPAPAPAPVAVAVAQQSSSNSSNSVQPYNNYAAYIANFSYRLWHRFARNGETDERFLQTYLLAVKADLRSELETRVGELVMTVYDDLYSREDEDF